MKLYTIFDIDNCIADDSERIPFIDQSAEGNAKYAVYHSLCDRDTPHNQLVYRTHEPVILLTGLVDTYRSLREAWLDRHGFRFHLMLTRHPKDDRKAVAVKRDMLEELAQRYGIGPNNIRMAFDDRQDIVDMYRFHGIDAAVLAIHPTHPITEHHR